MMPIIVQNHARKTQPQPGANIICPVEFALHLTGCLDALGVLNGNYLLSQPIAACEKEGNVLIMQFNCW